MFFFNVVHSKISEYRHHDMKYTPRCLNHSCKNTIGVFSGNINRISSSNKVTLTSKTPVA